MNSQSAAENLSRMRLPPPVLRELERWGADIRHSVVEVCFYNLKLLCQVFPERRHRPQFHQKFSENVAELPRIENRLEEYLRRPFSGTTSLDAVFGAQAQAIRSAVVTLRDLVVPWRIKLEDTAYVVGVSARAPQAIDRIMSALQQIKSALDAQKADVAALVRKAVSLQSQLLQDKNIQVLIQSEPLSAFVDEPAMLDVCVELLRNVAEHAFTGSVPAQKECRVAVYTDPLAPDVIVVSVRDNGCGMLRRSRRGHGHGLSMVRTVIEQRHGGNVQIESRPHRGTTVELHLPARGDSISVVSGPVDARRLRRRRIVRYALGAVFSTVVIGVLVVPTLYEWYVQSGRMRNAEFIRTSLNSPGGRSEKSIAPSSEERLQGVLVRGRMTEPDSKLPLDITGASSGVEMVLVPAGPFLRGTMEGAWYEQPERLVSVSDFYMDKYEVTNREYERFDPAHRQLRSRQSAEDLMPVVNVTWFQAVAYCNWRSRLDGLTPCYDLPAGECDYRRNGYRLPTEAEWEKAARGTDSRLFPWGDAPPEPIRANLRGKEDGFAFTSAVGSFSLGMSPYGIFDLAGNVWEWCDDWYDAMFYGNSADIDPRGPQEGMAKVVRGGAWNSHADALRSARRYNVPPDKYYFNLGFRCVKNP